MKYSDYIARKAYRSKVTGAGLRVLIFKGTDTEPMIGYTTGNSARDSFEQASVEEAGEDGVNEIPTGRHSGSGNLSIFWSPDRNDVLPSRDTFIEDGEGVEYTILVQSGNRRTGTDPNGDGIVFNAFLGVKITDYSQSFGARGLATGEISYVYTDRKSGVKWAERAGNL